MADFYALIAEQPDRTEGLKESLIALCDALLNDDTLSTEQKAEIARLRARIQVDLSAFL